MLRLLIYISLIFFSVIACQSNREKTPSKKLIEPVASLYDAKLKPFYHGVASGDPLTDRVIIWTRITPEDSVDQIPVIWEVSENKNFTPILKSDSTSTSASRDYTVKIDVTGLEPGKFYYYRLLLSF
jgi:alkaline phosphatase D